MARNMDEINNSNNPEKGNLTQCINYRTISLINHVSKIMLKIV